MGVGFMVVIIGLGDDEIKVVCEVLVNGDVVLLVNYNFLG